jgi:hypothetical protein
MTEKRIERIAKLEKILESLDERLTRIETVLGVDTTNKEISESNLDIFVETLLADPEINTIIPDKLEKAFYRKILTVVMRLLEKTLNNIKIDIFNHRIVTRLEPA